MLIKLRNIKWHHSDNQHMPFCYRRICMIPLLSKWHRFFNSQWAFLSIYLSFQSGNLHFQNILWFHWILLMLIYKFTWHLVLFEFISVNQKSTWSFSGNACAQCQSIFKLLVVKVLQSIAFRYEIDNIESRRICELNIFLSPQLISCGCLNEM